MPVPADPGASRELYAAGMRSLGFEDLLDGPAGAPREGVRHPGVHVLAQELDDQWDYLRSRLEPRGAESPRLRRRLERIAAEIGETLGGEPGRVDGGDTADDDWREALARAGVGGPGADWVGGALSQSLPEGERFKDAVGGRCRGCSSALTPTLSLAGEGVKTDAPDGACPLSVSPRGREV